MVDGAVKGRRATVLDHACLFISHDVLDVGAGVVVVATTICGEVVGQPKKRVWSRASINVIIEEIESFLKNEESTLLLQGRKASNKTPRMGNKDLRYNMWSVREKSPLPKCTYRGVGPSGNVGVGEP